MKYLKVFLLSLVVSFSVLGLSIFFYINHLKSKVDIVELPKQTGVNIQQTTESDEVYKPVGIAEMDTLQDLIAASKRENVLVLGVDGGRADTIMLVSYEPDKKLLDIVTIPRDTYHSVPGYNLIAQDKINAVYGFGKVDGGSEGMRTQVSEMLGVPIKYFIKLDYKAVENIVNAIGGIEVTVKHDMKYDDPYSNPPLNIDIPAGVHLLKGKRAVEYLRWRKNNDNSDDGSDLTRTDRQIDFAKKMIVKSVTQFKLVKVVEIAFNEIYTNMPLEDMLFYVTTLGGFDPREDIATYRLPGKVETRKLSYYIHDPEQTRRMFVDIYKRGYETETEPKTESKTE